ncbi:MAG: pyridoxamine 5'-phosphate oxidase [Gemmatimonadales bacterium]
MNLADLRREYARERLDETSVDPDPLRQFLKWLDDATRAQVREPTAMTLATATPQGVPSARVVLLKGTGSEGFVFFGDRRSQKGTELAQNPVAALVFWWGELERQVRIRGTVSPISDAESNEYFLSRPEGSRLSAWASHQGQVVADRAALEAEWESAARRFAAGQIPRPPYWGGFRLVPRDYEFWQGRENRLHDRLRYRRDGTRWVVERLSP